MSVRLHDFIDIEEAFLDPSSIVSILSAYRGMIEEGGDIAKRWRYAQAPSGISSMCHLDAGDCLFNKLYHNLQEAITEVVREYYERHYNVLANGSFNIAFTRFVDPFNLFLHHVHEDQGWSGSMCSGDYPGVMHHQMTGRIVLANPESRAMHFFYEPNSYRCAMPEGSLIIHPAGMLYPHTILPAPGELIYLEFSLCPKMKLGESSESTTH